ncbi:S41 family peptidase [Vagococcus hydrophili]|uniref:Tail specific protease domain-containing protein n=1 Tax=Vagococcus hydrophili TaxID=2714947 RepID=A0A6G8AWM6_9ENTE|nr:S41 family peptidase [Vagococcus hydrophili]QIL49417.1 hypothetical protein G7082_13375 [Vagococcus hydrophili]
MNSFISILSSFKWFTEIQITLFVLNACLLIWYLIPHKKKFKIIDYLPSVGMIIASVGIFLGDKSLLGISLYFLTIVLFLSTLKNLFKHKNKEDKLFLRVIKSILSLVGMGIMTIALMSAGQLRYNPKSDFSEKTYSESFHLLNERMKKEYPFGQLKKVDWDDLENKYLPLMKKAEETKNQSLYYKTLRDYLYSFRDSHIEIVNDDLFTNNPIFKDEVGGGFGISTIKLDDGKVMVSDLIKDSPADRNGIKLGAEIVSWGNESAKEVYENITWSEVAMTTKNDQNYYKGRFMARAKNGENVSIKFKNPNEENVQEKVVTAYDDNFESLKRTRVKPKESQSPIESKILENNYGYIKIRYFLSNDKVKDPVEFFSNELKSFHDKNVKGIIIDLRDNPGGEDEMVVGMASQLADENRLYEYVSYYNHNTKKFEINNEETYKIKAKNPSYKGNIAVLINNRTISSGEGLPLALKGMKNVNIIGFSSTNGSFGVVTSPIKVKMPEGYNIQIPDGRSLDQYKKVQVDTDANGNGGVSPDSLIPLNEDTFFKKYVDKKDVEMEYAIKYLDKN